MNNKEIYLNPTVKQVVTEIRFPNLFYIERKIGDLQLKIMKVFPESKLIFRRQLLFADIGPEVEIKEVKKEVEEMERGKKIWQFESPKDFQLNISSSNLSIISNHHKTYRTEGEEKFRDIVEFVLKHFFEITAIPIINRIGLRYIDECPIPSKDNSTFKSWYNSVFPLDRFDIKDAQEMFFKTIVKRGEYFLSYSESFKKIDNNYKLILDFDGFALKITPEVSLGVLDTLYELISKEYEQTIKAPLKEYMRKKEEV